MPENDQTKTGAPAQPHQEDQRNGCIDPRAMGIDQPTRQAVQCESDEITFHVGRGRTETFKPVPIPFGDDGGILRQLREVQTSYLSYLGAHHDRLEARLDENETEQRKLLDNMKRLEADVLAHIAKNANQSANVENNHQSS